MLVGAMAAGCAGSCSGVMHSPTHLVNKVPAVPQHLQAGAPPAPQALHLVHGGWQSCGDGAKRQGAGRGRASRHWVPGDAPGGVALQQERRMWVGAWAPAPSECLQLGGGGSRGRAAVTALQRDWAATPAMLSKARAATTPLNGVLVCCWGRSRRALLRSVAAAQPHAAQAHQPGMPLVGAHHTRVLL